MDVGGNKRNPGAVIEMTGTPEVTISIDEFRPYRLSSGKQSSSGSVYDLEMTR